MRRAARLVVASYALGAVVDRDARAGFARLALRIHGTDYVLRLPRNASDAEVAAAAAVFCDARSGDLSPLDPAVAAGCPALVAAGAFRELRPRATRLTNRSIAIVEFGDGPAAVDVVTVATAPAPGLGRLAASIAAHGSDAARLVVLGLGLDFPGTIKKLEWTRAWLALSGADGAPILFVDAYDTLFQRWIDAGALHRPGAVVFGSDAACEADVCAGPLAATAAGFAYLNSGTYAGGRADVRRLLDAALAPGFPETASDQRVLSEHALTRASAARLDDGRLFAPLDMRPPDAFRYVDGAFALGGVVPLVLHGNRRGKAALDAMSPRREAPATVLRLLDALRGVATRSRLGAGADRPTTIRVS